MLDNPGQVCFGSTEVFNVSNGLAGSAYTWSVSGAGNVVTSGNGSSSASLFFGNTSGGTFTITVVETTVNGCERTSSFSRSMPVPTIPSWVPGAETIYFEDGAPVALSPEVQYTVSGTTTGGVPANSRFEGVGVIFDGTQYLFNPSLAGLGVRTLRYIIEENSCTYQADLQIEVFDSPIDNQQTGYCNNITGVAISPDKTLLDAQGRTFDRFEVRNSVNTLIGASSTTGTTPLFTYVSGSGNDAQFQIRPDQLTAGDYKIDLYIDGNTTPIFTADFEAYQPASAEFRAEVSGIVDADAIFCSSTASLTTLRGVTDISATTATGNYTVQFSRITIDASGAFSAPTALGASTSIGPGVGFNSQDNNTGTVSFEPSTVFSNRTSNTSLTQNDVLQMDITYSINDINSCLNSETKTYFIYPTPEVTIRSTGFADVNTTPIVVCEGSADFTLTAYDDVFNGAVTTEGTFSGNELFQIGTGATAQTFFRASQAAPGNYVINFSYTDPRGCNDVTGTSRIIQVDPLPIPTFNFSRSGPANDDAFCSTDETSIFLQPTAGGSINGEYTLKFKNAFGAEVTAPTEAVESPSPSTGQATVTPSKLYALAVASNGVNNGTVLTVDVLYTVENTATGCTNTSTKTLTINPQPTAPILVTNAATYCSASAIEQLAVSGATGATFRWFADSTLTQNVNTGATYSNIPLPTVTEATVVDYYVVQTLPNTCFSNPLKIEFTVFPIPEAPVAQTPPGYCSGNTIQPLRAEGTNLRWYSSSSLEATSLVGTGSSLTPAINNNVAVTTARTYYVTQTTNGCESPAASVTINISPLPALPNATQTVFNYCSGQEVVNLRATGASLRWYSDAALTQQVGSGSSFDPELPTEVEADITSTYYVTQTGEGCQGPAREFVVNQFPLPVVQLSGFNTDFTYCVDASAITISGTPAPGGSDIASFSGRGIVASQGNEATFSPAAAGVGTHTISYTFRNSNGCSQSTSVVVTINPLPVVSFTGLEDGAAFCSDAAPIELVGSPAGGVFSGTGIQEGTTTILPGSFATGGEKIVRYTFEDENGCSQTESRSFVVNLLPQVSLLVRNTILCIDAAPELLEGTVPNSRETPFFTGAGVVQDTENPNLALFNPAAAGVGKFTVRYEVQTEVGCSRFVERVIEVVPLPEVNFETEDFPNNEYCLDQGSVRLFGTPSGGTFSSETAVLLGNVLQTDSTGIGTHTITYTYTDDNGCENSFSSEVTINDVPRVDFDFTIDCNAKTLLLTDLTDISDATITRWEINYGDGTADTVINNFNSPRTHIYASGGNYNISIRAFSNSGCVSQRTKAIRIGFTPEAVFSFERLCQGEPVLFTNSSFIDGDGADSFSLYEWDFGDGTTSTAENPIHQFENIGEYTVRLTVTTNQGCTAEIVQEVPVLPYVSFNAQNNFSYTATFEADNNGWVSRGTNSSWKLGRPSGEFIDTASDGEIAWTTGPTTAIAGAYNNNENSFVFAPCFDLTGLDRPMLKMDIWVSSEFERDGAVLQISKDDGRVWEVVGELNDPINWYNASGIFGNPGTQDINTRVGWTGDPQETDTNNQGTGGWVTARHVLDDWVGESKVRFRIAFGSNNDGQVGDGFAFDNFQILNRSKTVLVENFTNYFDADADQVYSLVSGVNKQLEVFAEKNDAVGIDYHINESGTAPDQLFIDNKADPSARALYYDIPSAPRTVIDGGGDKFNGPSALVTEDMIERETLLDPGFDINISLPQNLVEGEPAEIQYQLTSLNVNTADEIVLHIATIERRLEATDVEGTGGLGIESFRWVLRKMSPSAAGTSFLGQTFVTGTTVSGTVVWEPAEYYNPEQVAIVAFVQNNVSKEVYQTLYIPTEGVAEVPTGLDNLPEELQLTKLYPNPASESTTVFFGKAINTDTYYRVFDVTGRAMGAGIARSGSNGFLLDVSRYPSGAYTIQLLSKDGSSGYLKLVVEHR